MSLLKDKMEYVNRLSKTQRPDGQGGSTTTWTVSDTFKAAIVMDTSTTKQEAGTPTPSRLYTVITQKGLHLRFHDVIQTDDERLTLRITSNGADREIPDSASFQVEAVTAEAWDITGEVTEVPEDGQ